MVLIADSGSTKTSWCLISKERKLQEFETKGMNPFFISENEILKEIKTHLNPDVIKLVKSIHFYGAGCSTPEKVDWLSSIFKDLFKNAITYIKTDINGAVIACSTLNEKSIVSILGTGSAFRIFDGKNITKKYSSLGYIIGDEGSGTHISKALLKKVLYQQFSKDLQNKFFDYFNTSREKIIENVYSQPLPNRYLAQFTKFCKAKIDIPEIEQIVLDSFDTYFKNHILNIENHQNYKLHFVGSIAFHFKDQLHKIARKNGLEIGVIIQKPINVLIEKIK